MRLIEFVIKLYDSVSQSIEFCGFFFHVHSKQVSYSHQAEVALAVCIYHNCSKLFFISGCVWYMYNVYPFRTVIYNLFSIEVTRAKRTIISSSLINISVRLS